MAPKRAQEDCLVVEAGEDMRHEFKVKKHGEYDGTKEKLVTHLKEAKKKQKMASDLGIGGAA